MPYQNNIPQANQRLKDSQPDLLANFQAIKQLIDVNHETFGAANEGKHKWVSFPIQGATPPMLAGEMALFSRTSSLTGIPELVVGRGLSGTATEFTSALRQASGWARLPSGILIKWDKVGVPRNALTTVQFAVGGAFPVFATVFHMQAVQTFDPAPTLGNLNTAPCVGNVTTTSFQVYPRAIATPNTGNVDIFYCAIGT